MILRPDIDIEPGLRGRRDPASRLCDFILVRCLVSCDLTGARFRVFSSRMYISFHWTRMFETNIDRRVTILIIKISTSINYYR